MARYVMALVGALAALTACSSPATGTREQVAALPSSVPSPPAVTAPSTPTSTGPLTLSLPTATPAPRPAVPADDRRFSGVIRLWVRKVGTPAASSVEFHVLAGPGALPPGAAGRLQSLLAGRASTEWGAWLSRARSTGSLGHGARFALDARVLANTPPLLTVRYLVSGAAGAPYSHASTVTVDPRTLYTWSTQAMVGEIEGQAQGTLDFLGEVQRSLEIKRPGDDGVAKVGVSSLNLAPTRTSLRVGVTPCTAFPCSAGMVEVSIPWDRLILPGVRLTFLPAGWGA